MSSSNVHIQAIMDNLNVNDTHQFAASNIQSNNQQFYKLNPHFNGQNAKFHGGQSYQQNMRGRCRGNGRGRYYNNDKPFRQLCGKQAR